MHATWWWPWDGMRRTRKHLEPSAMWKRWEGQHRDWLRRLQHYGNAHVFMLCFVLILWILASMLSMVSDASTSSEMVLPVSCISPRKRNTKCKVLSFWMLWSDGVLSSSTQSVSQIFAYFTSRKRVFWGVVFTPPVGYSRPPSAVNDLSVTKSNEFLKAIPLRFSPKFCKQRVAPFDRKPLLASSFIDFLWILRKTTGFSPLPPGGGRTRCRFPFLVLPVRHRLELLSFSFLVYTV